MNSHPAGLGWVVGFVLTLSTGAEAQSAEQIASRVQRFYDKTKTFKASFKQRLTLKAYNKQKNSEGVVAFAKPGKMSFRYSKSGNRVVADTNSIKVYEASNRQLYEQPAGKSQYPAALSFLVGGGNLKKSFLLRKVADFGGGYVLVATPKEATAAYQKLVLYVDGSTYHVRRVILVDAQGNRNRFDFSGAQVNGKIPASEFEFSPPPGTQVIR
jgi:outer membrane lipoprotein carrier protein